jgi:hypothetical protein
MSRIGSNEQRAESEERGAGSGEQGQRAGRLGSEQAGTLEGQKAKQRAEGGFEYGFWIVDFGIRAKKGSRRARWPAVR